MMIRDSELRVQLLATPTVVRYSLAKYATARRTPAPVTARTRLLALGLHGLGAADHRGA